MCKAPSSYSSRRPPSTYPPGPSSTQSQLWRLRSTVEHSPSGMCQDLALSLSQCADSQKLSQRLHPGGNDSPGLHDPAHPDDVQSAFEDRGIGMAWLIIKIKDRHAGHTDAGRRPQSVERAENSTPGPSNDHSHTQQVRRATPRTQLVRLVEERPHCSACGRVSPFCRTFCTSRSDPIQ